MNRRGENAGFTLVELMVATMLTGIIVLTAGVVLKSTQSALVQQTAVANLQDDMRVALPALYELARERGSGDVTVPAVGATGTAFTVGTTNIYRGNDTLAADAAGKNLVYARGTDKMVLSKGWVQTFSVIRVTNAISFTLVLYNTNDTMSVSGKVYFRN
jgi:prepilin-type N-terminal cleavage/methylation domain-containing protein